MAIASFPAEAATGQCSGTQIGRTSRQDSSGRTIAELRIYWNAATKQNCARLNHVGPTVGVPTGTGVRIDVCTHTVPQQYTCIPVKGGTVRDDDSYAYYAGPVYASAAAHCIHVTGYINWQADQYLLDSVQADTNPYGYTAFWCR